MGGHCLLPECLFFLIVKNFILKTKKIMCVFLYSNLNVIFEVFKFNFVLDLLLFSHVENLYNQQN